jgi:hypothetical protein
MSNISVDLVRGEYFPKIANKILVHYDKLYCDPNSVKDGDIVYCDTHHLLTFKDILNTKKDIIIITHNNVTSVCDNDNYGLNARELTTYKKWYAQNLYIDQENMIPIPVGFENRRWESHHNPKTKLLTAVEKEEIEPSNLVYFNCSLRTNFKKRKECHESIKNMKFVTIDLRTEKHLYIDYLRKIKQHKFVISPRGKGLDCHRTWEVLKMKRVPIIQREGQLEKLYQDMPILFVDDWKDLYDLDLENLYSQYDFIKQDYLSIDFWEKMIKSNLD